MLQGQGLGAGVDVDLVDTNHVAQTQSGNADLVLGALALACTAAVGGGVGTDFLDGVEEHQGGAAGSVHLAVVVDFHDLDVGVGEAGGGLLGQAAQDSDAQAHVAGIEDGDLPGCCEDHLLLLRGVAGGADHDGHLIALGVVQNISDGGVVGEVDENVGGHVAQVCEGLGDVVLAVDADTAHDLTGEGGIDQLAHGAVGAAEDGSHAITPSFFISFSRRSSFWGSMGVRGIRR